MAEAFLHLVLYHFLVKGIYPSIVFNIEPLIGSKYEQKEPGNCPLKDQALLCLKCLKKAFSVECVR